VSDNSKRDGEGSIPLDELNLKILTDMIKDAEVKSTAMARKYRSPLSTIQRRRAKLERTILKKRYDIDVSRLGWRQADLLISVGQGDSEEMAREIMSTYSSNVIAISMTIGDPEINLIAQALYQNTEELHWLLEEIRSVPAVKSIEWSEIVKVILSDDTHMIDRVFGNKTFTTPC